MKNILTIKNLGLFASLLIVSIVGVLSSCNNDNLTPGETGSGTPVILSVRVLDTVTSHKDSLIIGAEPYTLLAIHGQNIAGVVKAYFNDFETGFNINYNTSTDLIISVPPDAPTDSTASNTIKLVTGHGTAIYNFKIIAKPAIYSFDKPIFGTGRGYLTFKGKNFADMEKVVAFRAKEFLTEEVLDSVVCEIIFKSPEIIVVNIPEDTLSRVTLDFTNSSGTTHHDFQFVNGDVAMPLFTDDFATISNADGDGKWSGDSWANPLVINSDQVFGGTKSFSMVLDPGGWKWFGFTSWWPRFYYESKYRYLTFAIKGGDTTFNLWLSSSASSGGNASFPDKNKFQITAKIWNYYMVPVAELDLLPVDAKIQQFGFRTQGPDNSEFIYVDDVMLVK